MLIPERDVGPHQPHLPKEEMTQYLQQAYADGTLTLRHLEKIIPKGTDNTFEVMPDRQALGFKYAWEEPNPRHPTYGGADADAPAMNRWVVHGHSPDMGAPDGRRAHDQWVVRVKCNNEFLLDEKLQHPDARLGEVDWISAKMLGKKGGPDDVQAFRNDAAESSHIPIGLPKGTKDDSDLGKEESAPRPRGMSL